MLVLQVDEIAKWEGIWAWGIHLKLQKKKFMPNDTVEGEQLAREIAPFILKKINKQKIPLMVNLIKTIQSNKKLKIKV